MRVDPMTLYFEDLNDDEAMQLLRLAEKLSMRAAVALDNPLIKQWLDAQDPTKIKEFPNDTAAMKMSLSAGKHFMKRVKNLSLRLFPDGY